MCIRDRNAAADQIEPVYSPDPERSQEVLVGIGQVFDTIAVAVFLPEPEPVPSTTTTVTEPSITTTASTSTSTTGGESTTTTIQASARTEVSGIVFLDADGDGDFDVEAGDFPKVGATVAITGGDGAVQEVETDQEGRYRAVEVEVGTVI